MIEVDIITTHYRNTEKFSKCLASVLEKTRGVNYNWYIWCNDPNDKVKKLMEDSVFCDGIRYNDKIIPIFNDTNTGSFSSNNNQCIREGASPYVLILNDDVDPIDTSWLYNMLKIIKEDKSVGVVGSLLLYPNGLVQHAGVMWDERTNGLPYHIMYRQQPSDFISYDRVYQAVTGACMLFRREDWEKVGGFNEKYWYMYEDIHFCLDIKQKLNKSSVYCGTSRLIHHEGISGQAKNNPRAQENINLFKKYWAGKIKNDHNLYLKDKSYMLYTKKVKSILEM